MSSILTNTSAMVALQTLKGVNTNLNQAQNEIATGKSVGSARDNAAVWAISKVMEADVKGFSAISDSLSLGESTVAVARKASETVTDLLTDIKKKIISAQEDNIDRGKLQTDIAGLRDQITSVVNSAQFNGLNLVNGSVADSINANDRTGVDILASTDRDSGGKVTTRMIGVDAQNLSTTAGISLEATALAVSTDGGDEGVIDPTGAAGGADSITLDTFAFLDGDGAAAGEVALKRNAAGIDTANHAGIVAGDRLALKIGTVEGAYIVQSGDTAEEIVTGLRDALLKAGLSSDDFTLDTADGKLKVTNTTENAVGFALSATRGAGGLAGLGNLDVSTKEGAKEALSAIETLIQTAVDASAAFGSVENRIGIQADFVSKLSDALKTGIGTLVDADMEEASARLQALQVQQQLGIQALSIANQAPQNILSLFR